MKFTFAGVSVALLCFLNLSLSPANADDTDLDVTYIQRLPQYDYDAEKNTPAPGDTVTFHGHIRYWGDEDLTEVAYTWAMDNIVVGSGTLTDLQPGREYIVTRQWDFEAGAHSIKLTVDPENRVSELSETNNAVEDRTDALIVGFWVEQTVYDYFHQYQQALGVGANSWEDWAQRQISRWNTMCAQAVWPSSPDGVIDRFRLGKIVVVSDGSLPLNGGIATNHPDMTDKTVDLMWGFPYTTGMIEFYSDHTTIDDGNPFYIEKSLLHELGHARYLIDNYGFDVHNTDSHHAVRIYEGDIYVAGSEYMPFVAYDEVLYYNTSGGVMTGPYEFAWSPYEAAALNRIAGLRATCGNYNAPCNIGAFLQDLPENNHILIVDKAGLPMPGADVLIYNATGNGSDWYGKTIDNTPDQSYTADDDGYIHLPRNPFNPGGQIIHTYGHANGTMVLRIAHSDHVWYRFQEVADYNMEYWKGNTQDAYYTIATDLVPVQTCPPADMAENNAENWEGWAEGGIDGESYFENDTNRTAPWSTGLASVKFVTDGAFDTYLRYPGAYEAQWDLSEVDYLYISVYAENPSAYNFQEGPAVRLVDQDGSYFEYNFYENGGVKTLINDAVGQWIMLEIPLDAPEDPEEGWGRSRVGTPDLAGIRYLEIHADTWDSGFTLWIDDTYFDPQPSCCPADLDNDRDVDGKDLALLAADLTAVNLNDFAQDFGKAACP
nr:CARDB domain-containing protein [uncultured Desulfobacter sp.]